MDFESEAYLMENTIQMIQKSGHTPEQIVFIGLEETGHECSWLEFCDMASESYWSWSDMEDVNESLIIVFSDGHKMWRRTCMEQMTECWEFSTPFVRPAVSKPFTQLRMRNDC